MTHPFKRTYKPRNDGYDSRQEKLLCLAHPNLQYHPPNRLDYILELTYCPDFYWGKHPTLISSYNAAPLRVYIEAKEWFNPTDTAKYIAVVDSNPGMYLVVITPKIYQHVAGRIESHPRIEVHVALDTLPKWMYQ